MAYRPRITILGGGISGISAALLLLEAGFPVTLAEARNSLGGRAFSFDDSNTGDQADNGQHVIVGCCRFFLDFIDRLDARDRWHLQRRLSIPISARSGKIGGLNAGFFPAPFHLLPSFLAYPHLGAVDKFQVLKALFRAKSTNRSDYRLEQTTFLNWLRQQGQSPRAIQNFWDLLLRPTLNDHVSQVSAAMGLMVVQQGMLAGYHAADLGYPLTGLSQAIGQPAHRKLTALGCQLLLGSPIKTIQGGVEGITQVNLGSGAELTGGIFLSALPPQALLPLLPQSLSATPPFQDLSQIETSPIVNIHFWYDRPVMDGDFCAFTDSPLQWVFNQSRIHAASPGTTLPAASHHICISLSAAWEYIDQSRDLLIESFSQEMSRNFPAARDAKLVQARVIKQRHATFRCLPGVNTLRPGPQTPIPNLFLAGEWTNTGWPSTMESAVRSGYAAARAIVAEHS